MAHCYVEAAERILDKEFPVLDKGFVRLVDYLGGDERIVQAARVSYGRGTRTFREDAALIERKIRAFNPQPGASTATRNAALKIWRASMIAAGGAPGTILEAGPKGIIVACGSGALAVQAVQPAGSKRMTAAAFLAGRPLPPGTRLGH